MARGRVGDRLGTHEFHLIDVDFSLTVPPWVLLPIAGFSSITMPEVSIESKEVTEGTDPFVHHVLGKATTNTITLQKGVSSFNADFWRWTMACLYGNLPTTPGNILDSITGILPPPGKRRNMLLMHLTSLTATGLLGEVKSGDTAEKIKAAALLPNAAVSGISQGLAESTGGLVDLGFTSVPGKVYMLFDCLPVSYKPGSDFDANSNEISIEELTIQMHRFEEFSLMA